MDTRRVQLLWLLLLFGKPAHAACPATPEQAAASARRVESAFTAQDSAAFHQELSTLNEQLGCLTAPPDALQAAAVHEALGLASYKDRGKTAGLAHFGAMCSQEAYVVPESVQANVPVAEWISAACALPPDTYTPYALNPGYRLFVDGQPAPGLPDTRAALVIVQGPGGVAWSGVLGPGEVPPLGAWNLPPASRLRPLSVSAAAVAAGSGVLWGTFALQRADLIRTQELINAGASPREVDRSADELVQQLGLARGLGISAGVTTGVAIGLAATAWARQPSHEAGATLVLRPGGVMVRW